MSSAQLPHEPPQPSGPQSLPVHTGVQVAQAPRVHVFPVHAAPQVPQFASSAPSFTHVPSQHDSPIAQSQQYPF
jgi:hypothetical protein